MAEYVILEFPGYIAELIADEITLIPDSEFMKSSISISSIDSRSSRKDLTFVIFVLSAPIKLLMKSDFEHFGLLVIFCFQQLLY